MPHHKSEYPRKKVEKSDPRFVIRLASKNASSEPGAIIRTKARSIALTVTHIKTESIWNLSRTIVKYV